MRCDNTFCFLGDGDDSETSSRRGCCACLSGGQSRLCCGVLGWKKAMLLIAFGDFISIAVQAYGTSGATLGEVETRLEISHFFNITMEEDEKSSFGSEYYIIYIMGLLLFVLRLITIFFLVLGSQSYRPCNVLLWIVSAPIVWSLFFVMQIVLLLRYYGEDNQMSRFWVMWNDKVLLSLPSQKMEKMIAEWQPNPSSFGQPCATILITSIVTFFYTIFSTFYVSLFYCKQTSNQIH